MITFKQNNNSLTMRHVQALKTSIGPGLRSPPLSASNRGWRYRSKMKYGIPRQRQDMTTSKTARKNGRRRLGRSRLVFPTSVGRGLLGRKNCCRQRAVPSQMSKNEEKKGNTADQLSKESAPQFVYTQQPGVQSHPVPHQTNGEET